MAELTSGSIVHPTGGALPDFELGQFINTGGTVSVRVTPQTGTAGSVVGSGNPLYVTLETLIAGEDLTANVMKVEQRFSYHHQSAVGTTVIKSSGGFLHAINVGTSSSGGPIVLYDSASGTSGTIIATIGTTTTTDPLPTRTYDVSFVNGLVAANVGTQAFTVSYR